MELETRHRLTPRLTRQGVSDRSLTLIFSPRDDLLVITDGSYSFQIWNAIVYQLAAEATNPKANGRILTALFSRDGKYIFSGNQYGNIRIWDSATAKEFGTPLLGCHNDTTSLAVSPGNDRIAASCGEGQIQLWDLESRQQIGDSLYRSNQNNPFSGFDLVTFSTQGTELIGGFRGSYERLSAQISDSRTLSTLSVKRLIQPWPDLAKDACNLILGPEGRRFSQSEIDADPLLFSEWKDANRDVCATVEGVAPLKPAMPTADARN